MKHKYLFNPELVHIYIKEHNLTKKAFCEQCRISIYAFNKFCSGHMYLGVPVWLKIAEVLNVNPVKLLKEIYF